MQTTTITSSDLSLSGSKSPFSNRNTISVDSVSYVFVLSKILFLDGFQLFLKSLPESTSPNLKYSQVGLLLHWKKKVQGGNKME